MASTEFQRLDAISSMPKVSMSTPLADLADVLFSE